MVVNSSCRSMSGRALANPDLESGHALRSSGGACKTTTTITNPDLLLVDVARKVGDDALVAYDRAESDAALLSLSLSRLLVASPGLLTLSLLPGLLLLAVLTGSTVGSTSATSRLRATRSVGTSSRALLLVLVHEVGKRSVEVLYASLPSALISCRSWQDVPC